MIQVVHITDKNRKRVPVPDFLNKPVTGEEALQRARQYDEKMRRIAEGQDIQESR